MIPSTLFVGQNPVPLNAAVPTGEYVSLLGETFYRLAHCDRLPHFFMSIVSGSDHWLFISSNGGLTAGRANADSALFPYETEDKIYAHADQIGSFTALRVTRGGRTCLWRPFSSSDVSSYRRERHLYKSVAGHQIVFEEINHDLGLTLRTAWRTGDRFGFIRTCWLENHAGDDCDVELLDGLQQVMPHGATSTLQTKFSNLLHAYKRSELEPTAGVGLFTLSATLSDRPEPSESLQATVVWQVGLSNPVHLLCTEQVDTFLHGGEVTAESDICGRAGAYLVQSTLALAPGASRSWHVVADVNYDRTEVLRLVKVRREHADLPSLLEEDILANAAALQRLVASADGLQLTAQRGTSAHHFANVMFNVMRGGVPASGHTVEKRDLLDFIQVRNRAVLTRQADWLAALPATLPVADLQAQAAAHADADLVRLVYEYLPLTFSRRHGDPSRPWNQFSINVKRADGSPRLDYQGNWRDIFQNWEPLALAFPDFVDGMIAKFLNATTADGYNPYRVTRDGIEWEGVEPNNPWANIGYWSDHQIIYLLKLLEVANQVRPGVLERLEQRPVFASANVPYRLKSYAEMLADGSHTIEFDESLDHALAAAVTDFGTDARLHRDQTGAVVHVSLTEKLLVLLLAKITNLVPGGGIWMNTQRPEWNDANNALVGKGLSVVTVGYLRRFIVFWRTQLATLPAATLAVSPAVATLLANVHAILAAPTGELADGFSDTGRRAVMDGLGQAATAYRSGLYSRGLSASTEGLAVAEVDEFLALALRYVDQTLRANRRPDGLYHAYNILRLGDGTAAVDHLYPMLEGQVSILSAGLLTADETVALLKSLRQSDLYRADQHSYMLYPNRRLPGFLEKNHVPAAAVAGSKLVAALTAAKNQQLLKRDDHGDYHFNTHFRNARDVVRVLDTLAKDRNYAELVATERAFVLDLFETTFNHRAFTGRSGTFFAYEGLGSIYWHMVAKLLLAVQEGHSQAVRDGADTTVTDALEAAYYDVRAGLGFTKTPSVYGAFPSDPYSHSPAGAGARQPGMTGQVKEEILTRWGELGVAVAGGTLRFEPTLLRADEFLTQPGTFAYVDTAGRTQTLPLPADSLAFTWCQTPVVVTRATSDQIDVRFADGHTKTHAGTTLDAATSRLIFGRTGAVSSVHVSTTRCGSPAV